MKQPFLTQSPVVFLQEVCISVNQLQLSRKAALWKQAGRIKYPAAAGTEYRRCSSFKMAERHGVKVLKPIPNSRYGQGHAASEICQKEFPLGLSSSGGVG